MKEKGIVRKSDDLCRLVIPKEIRDRLELGRFVIVYVKGKEIIIKKYDDSCTFCGKKSGLIEFKDKLICKKCIANIKEK